MARLQIRQVAGERLVEVTLSRRNLLTLLHKLEMPGSARQIVTNDCYEDGEPCPDHPDAGLHSQLPRTTLVLCCEDDEEHYGKRPSGAGYMHPQTERFVQRHGGVPGALPGLQKRSAAAKAAPDAGGDGHDGNRGQAADAAVGEHSCESPPSNEANGTARHPGKDEQ